MAYFTCQLEVKLDFWEVFLDEISIWISGLSGGDGPAQCGRALSNPFRA